MPFLVNKTQTNLAVFWFSLSLWLQLVTVKNEMNEKKVGTKFHLLN